MLNLGPHKPHRSIRTLWLRVTCRRCHQPWECAGAYLSQLMPASRVAARVQPCRGVAQLPAVALPNQAPPLPRPVGWHVNGGGRHRREGPPPGYTERRF